MKPNTPFVVILDSDPGMSLSLRHLFQAVCGLSVELCDTPEEVNAYFTEEGAPDLVIIGRVDDRGRIVHNISSRGRSFVLVIDRDEAPCEAEEAFLAGANDVIRAPFRLRALALRMRERLGVLADEEGQRILEDAGPWEAGAYIANHAGLTSAEAQIAHVLISHNGEIVTRDALSFAIDHRPWEYGDRKFDVHVAKIRKKLSAVFGDEVSLSTVRSVGYLLEIDKNGIRRLLK